MKLGTVIPTETWFRCVKLRRGQLLISKKKAQKDTYKDSETDADHRTNFSI